jgi:hypothetical protein
MKRWRYISGGINRMLPPLLELIMLHPATLPPLDGGRVANPTNQLCGDHAAYEEHENVCSSNLEDLRPC